MVPEMEALRVWVSDVRRADTQNLLAHQRIGQHRRAQGCPVRALAAGDDVVNGSQGEFLVVEVAVVHLKLVFTFFSLSVQSAPL